MTSSPPDEATLRGLAERLTGQPIQSVTRIPRGGNNRLMRVVSTDGRAFAAFIRDPAGTLIELLDAERVGG